MKCSKVFSSNAEDDIFTKDEPSFNYFLQKARSKSPLITDDGTCGTDQKRYERLTRQLEIAQKMTNVEEPMLWDSHNRFHNYLRISLTERCNLRCTYCMPKNGVYLQPSENLLTTDEILSLAQMFVKAGVDKIRLTGGEPLLRKDLKFIIAEIKQMGVNHIGLTTNGIQLNSKLKELSEAGLSHVNISLDTLKKENFVRITRRNGFENVLESIEGALGHGFEGKLKINCVVMRGTNESELADFAKLAMNNKIDVRFIEWMPFDSNRWDRNKFVSYGEMMQSIRKIYPIFPHISGDTNDTTKWFGIDGFEGRLGFITSMSDNFCGTCNRLRIMADGSLKVCLFDGNESLSLRDALRFNLSTQEIKSLVNMVVRKKKKALGGHKDMLSISKGNNRPMILIGG